MSKEKGNVDTIFLGVYGSFRQHPWLDSESITEVTNGRRVSFSETYRWFEVKSGLVDTSPDEKPEGGLYGVFMARAESMMLAHSSSTPSPVKELWGMNDANVEWFPGASGQVAWFQVGSNDMGEGRRRLPVQPLGVCARDALTRFGKLTLTGTQTLVPLHLTDGIYYLITGLDLFTLSDPAARLPIRITIDGGADDDVQRQAAEVFANLQYFNNGPFKFHSYSVDTAATQLEPPVVGDWWLGEGRHPVTFEATAPDWNLDVTSCVTEFCAEACREVGITTSVLIEVTNQLEDAKVTGPICGCTS